MAIAQAMCTSFKVALLDGEMDFSSNTAQSYKIALYTSSASLDAATTAYTASGEVVGTNYVAGGNPLTLQVRVLRRFLVLLRLRGVQRQLQRVEL